MQFEAPLAADMEQYAQHLRRWRAQAEICAKSPRRKGRKIQMSLRSLRLCVCVICVLPISIGIHQKERIMGMIQEFKKFALRGNVVDMAVGIIIGGAFGTVVKSLVDDVVMPPIGYVTSGVNFKDLAWQDSRRPRAPRRHSRSTTARSSTT